MTEDTAITSAEELNSELRELLRRAHESGVNVEGGWDCRNGTGYPDWDVVVTEVTKNDSSE